MKLGFVSLGCPKNLVDGEVMLGLARDAGHEITADAEDADVIVVNTCAFIDRAKEESVNAILEMAQLKRDGRAKRLVVTGCLGERYRDQLKAEIPEIDVVLGTGDVPEIVGAIGGTASNASSGTPVQLFRSRSAVGLANRGTPEPRNPGTTGPTYLYDASTPRLLTTPRHYAYVKIAEGCDYTCAFCIIPTLRGSYRSRDEDSIVVEAERLAAQGVRELLLISQDTTFFGIDRGQRGALARLLRRLNEVAGLEWIRLLYLYPTTITDDVLDAMAECEKVCKYIDLPLQHASADVLRRMRRPGNREAYDKLLARIRSKVPGVTLRTTFIVGFPGETEQDVAELLDFVRDTGFDHVGVFTYSHEEGTRAEAMTDDVPADVKAARRDAVMKLQKQIVAKKHKARLGQTVRVLVDGPSPESPLVLQGRLEGQAPDIDTVVYLSDCDASEIASGQMVTARLTAARGYDLVASVVGSVTA
ncbi:MAG TPA: 30S ribosomal protein S12 methylthiotransferase RimO [Vicinamibacterales bacterium]|nr:30S ribosomal protein S12 methylthiotransferase RimO [Vicinamibacterales bacterium]